MPQHISTLTPAVLEAAVIALQDARARPVRTNQEMIERISAVAQALTEVCRCDLSQRHDMNVELALHYVCHFATPICGGAGIFRVVGNFNDQVERGGFMLDYPAGWRDPG